MYISRFNWARPLFLQSRKGLLSKPTTKQVFSNLAPRHAGWGIVTHSLHGSLHRAGAALSRRSRSQPGPGRVSGRKSRQPEPVLVSCSGGGAGDTAGRCQSQQNKYRQFGSFWIMLVCVQWCMYKCAKIGHVGVGDMSSQRRICFYLSKVSESWTHEWGMFLFYCCYGNQIKRRRCWIMYILVSI